MFTMYVTNASLLTKTTSPVMASLNFEKQVENRLSNFTKNGLGRANVNFSYD